MRYVKTLVDVAEGGKDFAAAVAAAETLGLKPSSKQYPRLKVAAGAVISMGFASAQKWIERGLCEPTDPPK